MARSVICVPMFAVFMVCGMPVTARAQLVGGGTRAVGSGCPGMSVGFARSGKGTPVVGAVQDSSPAARSGLATGDELVTANGAPLETMRPLHGDPGTVVKLSLRRGTALRDVDLVLGRLAGADSAVTDSSSGSKRLVQRCVAVARLQK
ncbi:MAG: PDZ domain-containing protein [bacterium]